MEVLVVGRLLVLGAKGEARLAHQTPAEGGRLHPRALLGAEVGGALEVPELFAVDLEVLEEGVGCVGRRQLSFEAAAEERASVGRTSTTDPLELPGRVCRARRQEWAHARRKDAEGSDARRGRMTQSLARG